MKKLLLFSVLFFGIINCSFCQDNTIVINRLVITTLEDTIIHRAMNSLTTQIINNAKQQIKGEGAKVKFEAYSNFIKNQSNEISQTFTNTVIPEIYKQHFTADEINEIAVFYQTTTGKKYMSQFIALMKYPTSAKSENTQNNTNQFSNEESNYLAQFKNTATGKKLFQEIDPIISDLSRSLTEKYIPAFQQKLKKELARLDSKIWREAYRVKPEQVTVYKGEFSRTKKVVKIQNDKNANETYVTFAVPIYDNKWWIRFDKNIDIIDQKSGEQYRVLRLDNDLVLNKTMIVSDQKNKMIEVIMVFPLLKKSVKLIDIVEKISDDADLMSNNGGGDDNNLSNIKVKDYLLK